MCRGRGLGLGLRVVEEKTAAENIICVECIKSALGFFLLLPYDSDKNKPIK